MATTETRKPAVRQQPSDGTLAEAQQATAIMALEKLAQTYGVAALGEVKNRFERALMLARGLEALKRAVGPLMPEIMKLQGNALGFKTDRDGKGGYDEDTVRDCFIEATLRGFAPTGNEFNILARRCYGTKEGYAALVRKLVTDLRLEPAVPKMSAGGAVVPYKATWKHQGRADSLTREIPVRLNEGMGADGALGKATRKMLKSIFELVTGSEQTDPDEDVVEQLPPQPALAARPDGGALGPRRPTPPQLEEIAALRGRLGIDAEDQPDSSETAETWLTTLRNRCRGEGLFPEDEAPAIQQERR